MKDEEFDNATILVDRAEDNIFIIRKDIAIKFGVTAALIYAYAGKEAVMNWDYEKIQKALPFLSEDRIGSSLGTLPSYLSENGGKL